MHKGNFGALMKGKGVTYSILGEAAAKANAIRLAGAIIASSLVGCIVNLQSGMLDGWRCRSGRWIEVQVSKMEDGICQLIRLVGENSGTRAPWVSRPR